jgi:uncharacterized membrane-anchored protein YjiN (DUF445 family)
LTPGEGPSNQADPDHEARRILARYRAIATSLLVFMFALTLGAYALPHSFWADLLQASAKAGFVGGIADWFAVTALFRHPLGLPIPHTAIIPRQKQRLGHALGRFVSRHVLTEAEITRLMGQFDIGDFVRLLLTDPAIAAPLARALSGYLPGILASIEDGRARRVLARLMPRMVGGPEAGRVMARALRGLVESGRHQQVLDLVLDKLRTAMIEKEDVLRGMIEERVREQGGRLVGWALGATIATRVLAGINTEMDRMGPDNSDLRDAFDEWVRREITLMEEDPARAAEMGRALRRVMSHETVQAWAWDVWSRLRLTLEADAANPSGRTVALLDSAIGNLGELIATDIGARDRVRRTAERLIAGLLPLAQTRIATFIGDVVGSWDTATIVDRLELRVGKDLQYVRMNGTIVGFAVGGAAYAGLRAVFGHAAF